MEKITVESEDMRSLNVEKIGALFPNCITETRGEDGKLKKAINFDTLRQMLSEDVIEGKESYEFTWVGKNQSIVEASRPIQKTLRPCPEESVNWDSTENLYIEGDNLQVLKLLQKSYLGKVKMIYIDPPYNTGHDFVYHDNSTIPKKDWDLVSGRIDDEGNRLFKNTESNGRFHSDWCSMIYSRLLVARSLLADDGIIFISIDDNEVDNLRKISDEVFGPDNFINQIVINMNSLSGVKMTHVKKGKRYPTQKEYALLYKKGVKQTTLSIEKLPKLEWDKEYNLIIPELLEGQYASFHDMDDEKVNALLSKMHLVSLSEFAKENNIELTDEWKFSNAYRIFGTKSNRPLASKIKNIEYTSQIVGYTNTEGNKRFFRSDYNKEAKDPRIELIQAESTLEVFISDNWVDISNDGGVAQEGGVIYPNGKKPLALIKRMLKAANDKEGIYLDFFSGSSTTAHAVFDLNMEDGGNRRFIMVQIPEDLDRNLKIATDNDTKADIRSMIKFLDSIDKPHLITELGKERIRRSGRMVNPLGIQDLDVGFRVLKLDDWNKKDVERTPADTNQADLLKFTDNLRDDRSDLDLLFGCLIDSGLELTKPITSEDIDGCTVYSYNEGWLVGCFAENVPESVIQQIAAKKPRKVVFRDSSFADSPAKINVTEIFKMISPDTQLRVI